VDTVILDDGFQQWGIKKDLEIVTIDVGNPFGNRQMLPRGVLREPLSALRRADVIVLTKTNLYGCLGKLRQQLQEINPVALQAEAAYLPDGFYRLFDPQQGLSADELKGIDTCLLCAIADPDSFRKLMLSQGIAVRLFFKFPDHHFYSPQEIETLRRACAKNNIDKIITTEKDAVRLSRLREIKSKPEIIVFRMRLKITFNEERLLERLSGLYRL
jgi:tetraacyldisaccharide 4'-kinase